MIKCAEDIREHFNYVHTITVYGISIQFTILHYTLYLYIKIVVRKSSISVN